jgi:hypothetical protein
MSYNRPASLEKEAIKPIRARCLVRVHAEKGILNFFICNWLNHGESLLLRYRIIKEKIIFLPG